MLYEMFIKLRNLYEAYDIVYVFVNGKSMTQSARLFLK